MIQSDMIYSDIVRIAPGLLDALRGMAVSDVCDILPSVLSAAGLMHRSIQSVTPGHRICGQAITGFAAYGDGLIPHIALYLAKAGDVLVLTDGGQESRSALCGGNGGLEAKIRGIAGAVCDGAVRDLDVLRDTPFPTWSRTITAAHGGKSGQGWINKPISCGGVVVNPGDIVVADDDGVIVFPPSYAEFVIAEVRRIQERDAMVRQRVAAGERIFDMVKLGEKVTIHDGHWPTASDQS
jgi:4-hydroxy-4-methyl-2-oxoglutarate aldolase